MAFGLGSRMRHIVGIEDCPTLRGNFWGSCEASHCNQWGLCGIVMQRHVNWLSCRLEWWGGLAQSLVY